MCRAAESKVHVKAEMEAWVVVQQILIHVDTSAVQAQTSVSFPRRYREVAKGLRRSLFIVLTVVKMWIMWC